MRYSLEVCIKRQIPVEGFYVVTNRKKITDDFLICMIEWYAYCMRNGGEPDVCGVALSKNDVHERISDLNETLLFGLKFFRPEDKDTDFSRYTMINEGRAKDPSDCDRKKREYW